MGLRVINHLQAMLDRSKQPVSSSKFLGDVAAHPVRCHWRGARVEDSRQPPRRVATPVNHLLNLDEELDFADSAAAALQVVAGADPGALREMVADTRGNLPHLVDH